MPEDYLKQALKYTKALCTLFSDLKLKIIVTEQYPQGLGSTLKEISEQIPDFSPLAKSHFDFCKNQELLSLVKDIKGRPVLVGMESHICVLQSALSLKKLGKNPVVLVDAILSRKTLHFQNALEQFRTNEIEVSSVESLGFELLESSDHPSFRAFSKAIR